MRRADQLSPDEHRHDLAIAFAHLFEVAKETTERLNGADAVAAAERERVAGVIASDAAYRIHSDIQSRAAAEVRDGVYFNLDASVMEPTPELLRSGTFVPYTPRGEDGTVRSVKTKRRLLISQLAYLYSRGILDGDLYAACRWYKDRYEAAELEPSASVGSYGETVRGDPAYGHLARSEWGAEARSDFRWARQFISTDILPIFEEVILHDKTLDMASKAAKCRFSNATAAVKRGALELHGGIASRLPIEPERTCLHEDD